MRGIRIFKQVNKVKKYKQQTSHGTGISTLALKIHAFIFALRNIALGGYLDTRINI